MKTFPVSQNSVNLLGRALEIFAVVIVGRSFVGAETSPLMKYGSLVTFILDKLLLLVMKKKSNKNSTQSSSARTSTQYLYVPSTINLPDIFLSSPNCQFLLMSLLCLVELLVLGNSDVLFISFPILCGLIAYARLFCDWLAAVEAIFTQIIILNMNYLFLTVFRWQDTFMTVGCEIVFLMLLFFSAFQSQVKSDASSITSIASSLILSLTTGLVLPLSLSRKHYQVSKVIRFLGQAQGFFAFNMMITIKPLFFSYSLFVRVILILALPSLVYRLYKQINYMISGPFETTFTVDCKGSGHKYFQLPDEALECKVIFLNHDTNWACDQMDIFSKINSNVIFSYELRHAALISKLNFAFINGLPVNQLASTNKSLLIFALYVHTLNKPFPNALFAFDLQKYYSQFTQPVIDRQLIRYPHIRFISNKYDKNGKEIPLQFSDTLIKHNREITSAVLGTIVLNKYLKDFFDVPAYKILLDLPSNLGSVKSIL